MTFELQSEPLKGGLEAIWPGKIVRELPYRELKDVIAKSPKDWRAEAIAAASIGVPLDDLLDSPGRYSKGVSWLLACVIRMHGMQTVTTDDGDVEVVVGEPSTPVVDGEPSSATPQPPEEDGPSGNL